MGECMQSYRARHAETGETREFVSFYELLMFLDTDEYISNSDWILIGIANGAKEIIL